MLFCLWEYLVECYLDVFCLWKYLIEYYLDVFCLCFKYLKFFYKRKIKTVLITSISILLTYSLIWKWHFHSIQPSFKNCILSCSCNRYSWSKIYTISDAEEIAVAVIVEGGVRVTKILLLTVVVGISTWLFMGGKVSDIMSLTS